MDVQNQYFCPLVILQEEEKKECRGCLVFSNNFSSRRYARKIMNLKLHFWNQKSKITGCNGSIRSLGQDDLGRRQYKLHIYVNHQVDDPRCYNYSLKIYLNIKEVGGQTSTFDKRGSI